MASVSAAFVFALCQLIALRAAWLVHQPARTPFTHTLCHSPLPFVQSLSSERVQKRPGTPLTHRAVSLEIRMLRYRRQRLEDADCRPCRPWGHLYWTYRC